MTHPRPPRGFHSAKVDAAGRLKLPARYQEYLKLLSDKTLFVTLFQGMARIYTNGSWERNLEKLSPNPEAKARIAKFGDKFGCDVDVDPQGRITLPQLLRKELSLEDQPVQLRFYDDVIAVYSQARYEAELGQIEKTIGDDLSWAAGLGFNL
ncbi:MAG: hypothetical protein HZB13_14555 [Acidobacteria bacterium]|nr:hypothetical protein [Acidobacteriota bacterium]